MLSVCFAQAAASLYKNHFHALEWIQNLIHISRFRIPSLPSVQPIWQVIEKRGDVVEEGFPQRRLTFFLRLRHPLAENSWTVEGSWTAQCGRWLPTG